MIDLRNIERAAKAQEMADRFKVMRVRNDRMRADARRGRAAGSKAPPPDLGTVTNQRILA
jgi:hypothetical protein